PRVICTNHEERIAIGWRPHHRLGGQIAAGAWPVLDDELLAEPFRQQLACQSANYVSCAAGWPADDQPHGPRRIGLRPRNARHRRERGSARGQMQKLPSVGKFHLNLPSRHSITSSARASSVGGISRPSILAVWALITNSNLVDCTTGNS